MFFSLPPEIRSVVWKHARFRHAREVIKNFRRAKRFDNWFGEHWTVCLKTSEYKFIALSWFYEFQSYKVCQNGYPIKIYYNIHTDQTVSVGLHGEGILQHWSTGPDKSVLLLDHFDPVHYSPLVDNFMTAVLEFAFESVTFEDRRSLTDKHRHSQNQIC